MAIIYTAAFGSLFFGLPVCGQTMKYSGNHMPMVRILANVRS